MSKLDPRLRYLLRQHPSTSLDLSDERVSVSKDLTKPLTPGSLKEVGILLRCKGAKSEKELRNGLRKAGVKISAVIPGFYSVVSGRIALRNLGTLNTLDFVAEVEASRPLSPELDISRLETYTQPLHFSLPSVKGKGVVIGIIDSGIDYTHPSFRHEDGSSRILYLWDQRVSSNAVGRNNFGYGREYTKAELDKALSQSQPLTLVPHRDENGHGTHVAGIAAGNNNVSQKFTGIAPLADLIIVALGIKNADTLGESKQAVDAFKYIVDRANGRPVAINMSQGMNGGGHSGETVLETTINNLSRQKNVVIVKSAGNEGEWRTHAGGQISQGETIQLELLVKQNNLLRNDLELWYNGLDKISVAIQPPGSERSEFISPGKELDEQTQAGNEVVLEYDFNASGTGDTKATLFLSKGHASMLQPGTWKLWLRGDQIHQGRYDVWIEREYRGEGGVQQIRFSDTSADKTRTISIPGTAKRVITVGSYVTRPNVGNSPQAGQISKFSSLGPSRYELQKPEIVAPGEMIFSARSQSSSSFLQPNHFHAQMGGTSMAAPHVAGAAALMLSVRPELTGEQVKQILMRTARQDGFAITAPDNTWGNGKLMVENAVKLAKTVQFPEISHVRVDGKTISWQTNMETTSAVRFHTHQYQLLLGKNLGSQVDLTLQTDHQLTLQKLPVGTYYCEILAFSSDNWLTTDDNNETFYLIEINSD